MSEDFAAQAPTGDFQSLGGEVLGHILLLELPPRGLLRVGVLWKSAPCTGGGDGKRDLICPMKRRKRGRRG